MIHHHGTPITPRAELLRLAGRHFCVRYGEHRDVEPCHEIGQSVMLDNGAFPAWTKGTPTDWPGFYAWAEPWLDYRTTWAVIPDVIDGDEEANDALLAEWPFEGRGAPVWHMHEGLDRLLRLCEGYERVCIGSSGEYRDPGAPRWHRRMEEAFNAVCGNGPAPTWLHMLRAMEEANAGIYPFASVDSTNVAQNHAGSHRQRPRDVVAMVTELDSFQSPPRWHVRTHGLELVA